MWIYSQHSGELSFEGKLVSAGYSGAGQGKNNQADQFIEDVGPIPQGMWVISGPPIDTAKHGPYVLTLTPATGTITHGRAGFLMHGDSVEHPGAASEGCIIMPRAIRELVWESGDRQLQVGL